MKNKIKKLLIIINIIIIPIITTGCWDKVEPEERGFVLSMGIDKINILNESKSENFTISVEIPTPDTVKSSDGKQEAGGDKEKNTNVVKDSGETIWNAIEKIDSSSHKKINFGQMKVCILNERLLDDRKLFKETIDTLSRNKEIGKRLIIVACDGKAEKLIENYTGKEQLVGLYISSFYNNNQKNMSRAFRKNLQDIIVELSASGNTVIPKVKSKDGNIEFDGIYIIKDYRLSGEINSEDMKGYMFIKENMNNSDIAVEFDDKNVSMNINSKNTDIEFSESDDKIVCNIDIDVEGSIREYTTDGNSSIPYSDLEKQYSETIKELIEKSFDILQNDIKTDAFDFKEICRKKYYGLYLKFKDEWDNAFENMTLNTNVKVKITGAGSNK